MIGIRHSRLFERSLRTFGKAGASVRNYSLTPCFSDLCCVSQASRSIIQPSIIVLPRLRQVASTIVQDGIKAVQSSLSPILTNISTTNLFELSIWFIKRTFQPSIIRKKRKTGFLVRLRSVGGRKVLKRRKLRGRWRLGGGI